jgi:hypothetical protein
MSPKKTPREVTPPKAPPSHASQRPTPQTIPPIVELSLSFGWLWASLSGVGVLLISLLNHAPWWLSLLRAIGAMLILGFLVWYLSDTLIRGLLESRVAAHNGALASPEPPQSTHDLSA